MPPRPASSQRRLWVFRLTALAGLPLLLLLSLEAGLRMAGHGRSACFLLEDTEPGWLRTNPDLLKVLIGGSVDLQPLNFRIEARKPAGTIRVVVLGESAAQGIPVPAFGFATQLRAQLRALYPGLNIEVVNAGVAAISSHLVVDIARDLAVLEPDVYVVYMGNNDIVGPYGPGGTFLPAMPPRWVVRLSLFVRTTRTGQLLQRLAGMFAARGRPAKTDADSASMEAQSTPADDPRLQAVQRNFAANLGAIIGTARAAGAKVLVCTLASNLADCAPFLPQHRPGLPAADLERADHACTHGVTEWRLGFTAAARRDLTAALRTDPGYAAPHYLLGKLAAWDGDADAARREFLEAIRLDAVGFRPGPLLNDIVREIAGREPGAVLVDLAMAFGADPAATGAPPGEDLFVDHVHFTWEGNFRLARLLAERVAAQLPPVPTGDWLDSAACAAAVGYTPVGEAMVLNLKNGIIQSSLFRRQITHCEDLARLRCAMASVKAQTDDPALARTALATIQTAGTQDPGSPFLPELEEKLAGNLGQPEVALAAAARRRRLQAERPALNTDEAFWLLRAGRAEEARSLLEKTAGLCSPAERHKIAPTFVAYYLATGQTAAGLARLDALFAEAGAGRPHLQCAALLLAAGDRAGAEREYRAALAAAPSDPGALEGLLTLLTEAGCTAEAADVCLGACETQPENTRNNLRAAGIMQERGQDAAVVRLLLAAEKCGPVGSEVEIMLVRKLAEAHRLEDSFQHLALARRLAEIEDDRGVLDTIDGVLRHLHR